MAKARRKGEIRRAEKGGQRRADRMSLQDHATDVMAGIVPDESTDLGEDNRFDVSAEEAEIWSNWEGSDSQKAPETSNPFDSLGTMFSNSDKSTVSRASGTLRHSSSRGWGGPVKGPKVGSGSGR